MLSPRPVPTPDSALERAAFNAAFLSLGFRWYWDEASYDALSAEPSEQRRVERYLETEQAHMLRAYDAASLAELIIEAKDRSLAGLIRSQPQAASRPASIDPRCAKIGF